jgi:signal transduction histidine kinase
LASELAAARARIAELEARQAAHSILGPGPLLPDLDVEQRRHWQKFVMAASSNLRTAVAIIKMSLDLYEDTPEPEQRDQFIGKIDNTTEGMSHLIDDLIALSNIYLYDFLTASLETVNFASVASALVSDFRTQAISKNQQLLLSCEDELPPVAGVRRFLYHALANILKNAIQYTPPGGEITVDLSLEDEDVYLCISDTGIGIAASDLPHIFQPFYWIDKSEDPAYKGSRLGLAITHAIVKMHGGRITCESTLGEGSTFRVYLPPSVLS